MASYWMFDRLITTWIVRILYWIFQLGIIVLSFMIMSDHSFLIRTSQDTKGLVGLAFLVICSLVLRLLMEGIIVIFKISEDLAKIKNEIKKNALASPQPGAIEEQASVAKQGNICEACKASNNPGAKFCKNCGASLPSRPEGEV